MHLPRQSVLLKIVVGLAANGWMIHAQATEYAAAQLIGHLPGRMVNESSGLAASPTDHEVLWTHNDSGDKPRLFRFHLGTRELQEFRVAGAKAIDWEDMASFARGGDSFCLIADTGDNRHTRGVYQLYLVSEQPTEPGCLQVVQTVNFRYQDGAQDCEAVAFDCDGNQVILITKDWKLSCTVHRLSWPSVDSKETVVATPIATIQVAGVTGLDISPDGQRRSCCRTARPMSFRERLANPGNRRLPVRVSRLSCQRVDKARPSVMVLMATRCS